MAKHMRQLVHIAQRTASILFCAAKGVWQFWCCLRMDGFLEALAFILTSRTECLYLPR